MKNRSVFLSCITAGCLVLTAPSSAQFPPTVSVDNLNGINGFNIKGLDGSTGMGVAIEDLNADGVADLLLGAADEDRGGSGSGGAWIVFGQFNFTAELDITLLPPGAGVELRGAAINEKVGAVLDTGADLNGDGLTDIVLGAAAAGNGKAYVVFGRTEWPDLIELSALNGDDGFVINGISPFDSAASSVAFVGDLNGDGIDDLALGAPTVETFGFFDGAAYVVYGDSSFPATLELSNLDGLNGFTIEGFTPNEKLGSRVRGAGDVNSDGLADLLVGASNNDNSGAATGAAYLVLGQETFPETLELDTLDGTNGSVMMGLEAGDQTGWALAGPGDLNGDGRDDFVVGAHGADRNDHAAAGAAYVVFGADTFARLIELDALNGSNGFEIRGSGGLERAAWALDGRGDLNGDGLNDLVLGASPDEYSGSDAGGWALFGRDSFAPFVNLGELDGFDGYAVQAQAIADGTGRGLSGTGDLNRDGLDDAVFRKGRVAFIVYGRSQTGITLGATGLCPGVTALRSTRLAPGASAEVYSGFASGDGIVDSGPCAGTQLGLEEPTLLKTVAANGNGEILVEGEVAAGFCGRLLQVVESASCDVSNVTSVPE